MIIFWLADFIRKGILVVVMIFMRQQIWLQLTSVFVTSQALIIIANTIRTRETKFQKCMDILNEVKLTILMYHMINFSAAGPDESIRFQIGYSCAVLILLALSFNIS